MREVLLALLTKEPSHGYELKAAIESLFGELWPEVNVGQVYSTLGRLERLGLIRSATVAQGGRPDKRVYELTANGRDELRRWIDDLVPPVKVRDTFVSKVALAWTTGLADPIELIDRQRREYLLRLRDLGELANGATGLAARIAVEAATLHLRADLQVLDACEAAITEARDG
jgi:DNA-binding PadR family transcriptional regulator